MNKDNKQNEINKQQYKSIQRSVSLPRWLNEKAIESGINISMVLQKALIEILFNGKEPI